MKSLSLLKNMALACGAMASVVALSSCSSPKSPAAAASRLAAAPSVTVYSYNDAAQPENRKCVAAGPLSPRGQRALKSWLRESEIRSYAYTYPQYYITVPTASGKEEVWAICSDQRGHMTGVLIPATGTPAWHLPFLGGYKMYVCTTDRRADLGAAIMEDLKGYDTYRINARKAAGMKDPQYLLSVPDPKGTVDYSKLSAEQAAAARAAREEAGLDSSSEDLDLDSNDMDLDFGDDSSSDSSSEEESSDEDFDL